MLSFHSANVRSSNTSRAIDEGFEIAFGEQIPEDLGVIIVNTALGHSLDKIAAAIKAYSPKVMVLGASCSGVTGRDGVGESMNDLALMAVSGPKNEYGIATVTEIYGHNSYEKGKELALSLKTKAPSPSAIYLLCPGIDIANDLVVQAFDEVFGPETVLFGGTSSDNMRGLINYQYLGDTVTQHGAWAVGFSDPTIKAITRATHGFTAYGDPMVVTRAQGNRIYELNDRPAWQEYTERLGLTPSPDTNCKDTIPVGALAEELPADIAREYGNPHILRAITCYEKDGSIYYPMSCREGLKLWLTMRDEDLIFSELQRTLDYLRSKMGSAETIAVCQSDCLARGRFLFNKVIKDEIIAMMHASLSNDGVVPPWIGMYGFGEYARLGGKNTYHNYTTALLVLYR